MPFLISRSVSEKKFLLVLLGGFVLSFVIRLIALSQTPFANGWDAYFYLVQVQSIFETGKMHSEEWTLFYPLLLLFSLGGHYVWAVKIVSSLLAALVTLSVGLISYKKTNAPYWTICLIAFTIFSPELTYFAAQWTKNLLGIVLFLFLIYFLQIKKIRWAIIFLILGLFGHRMTALLGSIYFALWIGCSYINKKTILITLLSLMVLLIIIQFLPGLLSVYDVVRFKGILDVHPQLPVLQFLSIFGYQKTSTFWQVELWTLYILFFIALFFSCYRIIQHTAKKEDFLLLITMIALWFPFYHITLEGIPYRLFHSGMIIAFLLPTTIFNSSIQSMLFQKMAIALTLILIAVSFISYKGYNPGTQDPPYPFYQKIVKQLQTQWETTEKPELIIAHKALAEFVTYHTQVDAMPWVPEYDIPNQKLYRIGYFPYLKLANYYIGDKITPLGHQYGYLMNKHWEKYVKEIVENEPALLEEHQTWKNPHQIRPDYLLKK